MSKYNIKYNKIIFDNVPEFISFIKTHEFKSGEKYIECNEPENLILGMRCNSHWAQIPLQKYRKFTEKNNILGISIYELLDLNLILDKKKVN